MKYFQSGAGHQGGKPSRAVYLRDGRIFSTGFSKMAERQYAVWDEVCIFFCRYLFNLIQKKNYFRIIWVLP